MLVFRQLITIYKKKSIGEYGKGNTIRESSKINA